MRYVLGFIFLVLLCAPTYSDQDQTVKLKELQSISRDFFEGHVAINRPQTRAGLCDNLPSLATKRPDPDILNGRASVDGDDGKLDTIRRAEIHLLMHMLYKSCQNGILFLDPTSYGYDCYSNGGIPFPFLGNLISNWNIQQDELAISCIAGSFYIDNVKLKRLNIFGSTASLSLSRSSIGRIVINSFPLGSDINFRVSNSNIENDIIISGFGKSAISIESSTVGDSVYVNSWVGSGGIQILNSSVKNTLSINRPDIENYAQGHGDESVVTIKGGKFGSLDFSELGNGSINCEDCQVAGSVSFANFIGGNIALRGARIENGLTFDKAKLSESTKIDLANVRARYLQANGSTFKYKTEKGFDYIDVNLGGARFENISGGADRSASMLAMSTSDWINFLGKSQGSSTFDPQPYVMIAQIMIAAGFKDTANDLHVKRVELSLANSGGLISQLKYAAGLPTGYGYKPDTLLLLLAALPPLAALAWMWFNSSDFQACAVKRSQGFRGLAGKARYLGTLLGLFLVYVGYAIVWLIHNYNSGKMRRAWRLDEKILNRTLANPDQIPATRIYAFLVTLTIFFLITPLAGLFD